MASPELPFCTYRFCNIPPDFDDTALRAIIPLDEDEKILFSSLSPDYDASRASHFGTITWSTIPSRLRSLTLEDSTTSTIPAEGDLPSDNTGGPPGRGNEGTMDSHFMGLTPLNPGPIRDEQAVDYVRLAKRLGGLYY
jgi:hypothetical protein